MKKRIITAIVALTMVAMCLAGCGNKPVTTYEGSPVTVNGDDIYPIQCDDELTYWTSYGGTSQQYANFGETPLGKELEKRTGVKVKYVHPSGNGAEQLQLLIASDSLCDVVEHGWNNYAGGPQAAIDGGVILDITDLIDRFAPTLKKILKENPERDKLVKTDDGKYYAFPFMLEEGILQCFYGPVIRKDWLDKINMEAPETIDEWEAVLTAFKDKCGATIPFEGSMANLLSTFASGFNAYHDWYLDNGEVKYGPYTPQFKDLLAKLHDWYVKGLIDPDFTTVDGKTMTANFLNGISGAQIGYAGGTIGDNLRTNSGKAGYDLAGVKYPAVKKGDVPEFGQRASIVNMGVSAALSTTCKNPELAARFLDYGYTEEGHNLFNFGIEGESYNWVDGYPKYTDYITNNPDGLTMSQAMMPYTRSSASGIMMQDTRYMEQYYSLPQQQEAQKTWMENSNMEAHMLPQLYIESQNSDRDADIMSSVKTYTDEMIARFITGGASLDQFDSYMKQIKDFGIEEAIQFRQDAYNKFMKR